MAYRTKTHKYFLAACSGMLRPKAAAASSALGKPLQATKRGTWLQILPATARFNCAEWLEQLLQLKLLAPLRTSPRSRLAPLRPSCSTVHSDGTHFFGAKRCTALKLGRCKWEPGPRSVHDTLEWRNGRGGACFQRDSRNNIGQAEWLKMLKAS